jgi:ketosteroid isomerase-like protein
VGVARPQPDRRRPSRLGRHRQRLLGKLGPLSGGTFRAKLINIAVGGDHVVAVQHATAEHGGKRLDITGCQLMTVEDGRITSVRGHYFDRYALDDFWS